MKINFILNGKQTHIECPPLKNLLTILREYFGLTGTKYGCGHGECNSCLVFVNDMLVNSCLIPAFRLVGTRVTTIEGFSKGKEFQTIEKAFLKMNITGCAFCTPSLILATEALLSNKPHPKREEIIENLSSFFCLCSGYHQVVDAILYISELRSKKKSESKP
jgi:carbon-monoxide dehydrogenase small subunit